MENNQQLLDDLSLPEGFAAPNCTGVKYENWKLKPQDDRMVIRILPAYGSLLKTNNFGAYWGLHFGWFIRNPADPTKKIPRPFLCVEEKRNGMTVKTCPVCQYIAEYTKKWEAAKVEIEKAKTDVRTRGQAAGKSEQEIGKAIGKLLENLEKQHKPIKEWLYAHSLNKKFRIPGINKQGQFGIASVPYGVVKKLQEEMKKLTGRTYPGTQVPINPAGRKGVWFEIIRTGKASRDSDSAAPLRIQNADGSESLDFHVITNEQLKTVKEVLPDLFELMESNRISLDKMESLIALDKAGGGSADPDEVEKIFGINETQSGDLLDWATSKSNSQEKQQQDPAVFQSNQQTVEVVSNPVVSTPQIVQKVSTTQPSTVNESNTSDAPDAATVSDEDFDSLFK